MTYRFRRPGGPLSLFVDQLWYCADYRPNHQFERILPNGSMSLVVALRQDSIRCFAKSDPRREMRLGSVLVVGARDQFELIHTETMQGMAGVQFLPGGGAPFFSAPADVFSGTNVELENFWGVSAQRLRDRLLHARSPETVFDILEDELLRAAGLGGAAEPDIQAALQELSRPAGRTSIQEIGDRTGMSQRRFIDRFRRSVGLTPKKFARLQRFRTALRLANAGRGVPWCETALECGYFDQAHFNRDFRAFAGMSPSEYMAGRGEWESHVRVYNEA